MLDNFRRKDNPYPGQLRTPAQNPQNPQSPYSQLQKALTPNGAESAKPEVAKVEAPKPELHESPKSSRSGEDNVSKLIVGPDIKLKGAEITDCDTLVVEGRVEAAMDSRVIQIAEHGMFVGKAGIDVAEIRGRFEGELTVRKQLVIRATGHVTGKIRYGKVSIEEGGELSGDVAAIGAVPGALSGSLEQERKPAITSGASAQTQPGALFGKPAGMQR
jgi:cytoskeletal protein CcmA (bactofilin family)